MHVNATGGRSRWSKNASVATGARLVLVVFLLAGAWFAWQARQRVLDERQSADHSIVANDLLEVRTQVAWLHFDMLIDGLLAELDESTVDDARQNRFFTERNKSLEQLKMIADGETPSAPTASQLIEELNAQDETYDAWPYSAEVLRDHHYTGIDASFQVNGDAPLDDQLITSMLPALVVADAAAIELWTRPNDPPDWSLPWVEYQFDVVSDAPGWLGPDRQSPFEGNYMLDDDPERPALFLLDGSTLADLRTVWDYDQWLINNAEAGFATTAPISIAELLQASRSVDEATREQLRADVADTNRSIEAAAPDVAAAWGWLALIVGLGLGIFVLLLPPLRRRQDNHRQLRDLVSRDPLTGAHNRRYLEEEAAQQCLRQDLHHVVVMIDLDRFKLINDTWGHDVGDAMLIALAKQLDEAAKQLIQGRRNASAAVARTGGDEFVVLLHAAGRFDLADVEASLRSLAGPLDLGTADPVNLEFSLGIANTHEPAQISDLTKSADLAAYQDKTERSKDRDQGHQQSSGDSITINVN